MRNSNQTFGNPNVTYKLPEKKDHASDDNSVSRNDSICDFGKSGLLNTGIEKDVGKATHKCDLCQKEFASKGSLKNHTKRHQAEKYRLKAREARARKALQKIADKGLQTNSAAMKLLTKNNDVNASAKHSCGICDRTFDTPLGLTNHSLGHLGKRPMFQCDSCPRKFAQINDLNRHKLKHGRRRGTGSFECDICQKTFRIKKTLTEHILTHCVERPFNCAQCDKCFAKTTTLSAHMLVHSNDRPHECMFCNQTFKRKVNLNTHMERHFANSLRPQNKASTTKYAKHSLISSSLSCVTPVYGETFNEDLNPESSKPNHRILIETLSSAKDTLKSLSKDPSPGSIQEYCEDVGEKLFSCKDAMKSFDKGPDFECLQKCLDDTMKSFDESSEPLSLPEFHKVHVDQKLFSCKDTLKSSDNSSDPLSLPESHEAHIGENLFLCQDSILSLSNDTDGECILDSHEVACKDPFSCRDSVQSSIEVSDVESLIPKNGVFSENGFPCKVCGRRFTSEPSVVRHMIIHFRAARHKCPKCARCFQTSIGLKEHMKFHEEGCQFMCSICSAKFTGEDGLQAHLLNHTHELNVSKS